MLYFWQTLFANIFIALVLMVLLFISAKFLEKIKSKINYIIALTVGLLLGIVFLGFFSKLINLGEYIGLWVLLGLLLFYIFELFLHWHHCKDLSSKNSHCWQAHKHGKLMFVATFLHNFLHGIVLFGAWSISLTFGLATTLAIALHSIPQNIANLIMNHKNYKIVYTAAVGGVIGALITYPFYDVLLKYKLYILALISGGLLYIALADIFPEINTENSLKLKIIYFGLIIIGICIFCFLEYLSSLIK